MGARQGGLEVPYARSASVDRVFRAIALALGLCSVPLRARAGWFGSYWINECPRDGVPFSGRVLATTATPLAIAAALVAAVAAVMAVAEMAIERRRRERTSRERRWDRAALSIAGSILVSAVLRTALKLSGSVWKETYDASPAAAFLGRTGMLTACAAGTEMTPDLIVFVGWFLLAALATAILLWTTTARPRSDEGSDRARIAIGVWLAGMAPIQGLWFLTSTGLDDAEKSVFFFFTAGSAMTCVAAIACLELVAGVVLATASWVSLRARRRWLARVARGTIDGYRLRPSTEEPADLPLMATMDGGLAAGLVSGPTLLEKQQLGAGDYRTPATSHIAIARILVGPRATT